MRFKPNNILYVREAFCVYNGKAYYKDGKFDPKKYGLQWKSPLFMSAENSRCSIRIEEVSIQKLFDITEDEAKAEGFERIGSFIEYFDLLNPLVEPNPYVWAIKFTRIV
jgi:hypothetical protein